MGRCILAPSVGVTNELDNEGVDEKVAHLTHGTPLSSEPVQDGRAMWRGPREWRLNAAPAVKHNRLPGEQQQGCGRHGEGGRKGWRSHRTDPSSRDTGGQRISQHVSAVTVPTSHLLYKIGATLL